MKIRSITDVITNSSSEVFTLRTTRTPAEVHQWLKDNIKWSWGDDHSYDPFTEPEILTGDDELLRWMKEDFRYLWDSEDQDSVEDYKVSHCLRIFDKSDSDYDFSVKKGGLFLKRKFEDYCESNMTELLECFKDWKGIKTEDDFWDRYCQENSLRYCCFNSNLWPISSGWYEEQFGSFMKGYVKFIEEYFPDRIPEWWKIPEHLDVQYWKGKVGFSTTDENSILWEDMEKICDEFDGEHWHMG